MIPAPFLATPDYVARMSVAEGYNTNTYQAQDDPNVPVLRRHASPFTGLDGDVETRIQTAEKDLYILRLGGRLEHYEPLTPQYQSDDGAVNAAISARHVVSSRLFLSLVADGEVATLNGAHIADTTLFAFDPTLVRRTYWLSTAEAALTYEISKTWRIRQSVGEITTGTIFQPPTLLPNGQNSEHRGIDSVEPYVETDLFKDLSERTTIDFLALYQYAYNLYVLDLTQNPPRDIGPDKMAFATAMVGHTYRWSPELTTSIHGGGSIASAPPRDIDQRPVLSPAALGEVSYKRDAWSVIATAGYTYGTVNPRLGAGPSEDASVVVVGTPSRVGNWKNFSVLINGTASYSTLLTGVTANTKLGLYAADGEFRYALNPWLGLLGGYVIRYATFDSAQFVPPFMQQIVFVGFSAYWSTDRNIPALTTFVAPVTPPS